jgi:hypothetical protein
MKGANALLEVILDRVVDGLFVSLQTVIDYRGSRLVAAAVLPLTADSLIYGSADGGINVHDSEPEMSKLMKTVATRLNLRGHWVGTGDKKKYLFGPGDLEGHRDPDGKKFYVIDTARLFPPEAKMKTTLFIPQDLRQPITEINLSVDDKQAFQQELRKFIGIFFPTKKHVFTIFRSRICK